MKPRRAQIYKYPKSGKLAAIFRHNGKVGTTVIELSPNMKSILSIRNPKYIKRDMIEATEYMLELAETLIRKEGRSSSYSYEILRVLSRHDRDLSRWISGAPLGDLPVSPEEFVTEEEIAWAGRREGNLVGGIVLAAVTTSSIWFAVRDYHITSNLVVYAFIAVIAGIFLAKYRWKIPRKPSVEKLEQLRIHKEGLRLERDRDFTAAKTEFEKALEDYSTWKSLTPRQFELALSVRLKSEGYQVRATQYSKDGGVDIEAVDREERPVIVQAKQYSGNVGVEVVREMIGIRHARADSPRAVIYALAGFTKGAKALAGGSGIELRDIRTELLRI